MTGHSLRAAARAIAGRFAEWCHRLGCLWTVFREARAGAVPRRSRGASSSPIATSPDRGASEEHFALPRFLATFDIMACDQLTGLANAQRFASVPGKPLLTLAEVRERLAPVFAEADGLRQKLARKARKSDATLMLAVVVAASLLIRFAEATPRTGARNSSADAIAERFAAADSDGGDVTSLERRLDFAPRYRLVINDSGDDLTNGALLTMGRARAAHLPFDSLGVVIIRGLPAGTRLSTGVEVGHANERSDWAVPQGDLDQIEVVLPQGMWPGVSARLEIIDGDGVSRGNMALVVRSLSSKFLALTPEGDDEARLAPQGHRNAAASDIRTGAVAPVAVARPAEAPAVQAESRSKPSRRTHKKARSVRRAPPLVLKVRVQPQPAAPVAKTGQLLLFKPASESASGTPAAPAATPAPAVAPPANPVFNKPGVFPRSPMEEEAARR